MNNRQIKQHFVPQFYLKNFQDDNGYVYCQKVIENCKKLYKMSARSICYEKYLYDMIFDECQVQDESLKKMKEDRILLKKSDYEYRLTLEDKLSEIENFISHALSEIIILSDLSGKQKGFLALLCAMLYLRNPSEKKVFSDEYDLYKTNKRTKHKRKNMQLNEKGFGNKYFKNIESTQEKSLVWLIQLLPAIERYAKRLLDTCEITLYKIQFPFLNLFITSDNPVIFVKDGFLMKNHEKSVKCDIDEVGKNVWLLPLSPYLLLIFKRHEKQNNDNKKAFDQNDFVRKINELEKENAFRMTIKCNAK